MSLTYKLTLIFAACLIALITALALLTLQAARYEVESEVDERLSAALADIRDAVSREVQRRGHLNNTNAAAVIAQTLSVHPALSKVELSYYVGDEAYGVRVILTPLGPSYQEFNPRLSSLKKTDNHFIKEYSFHPGFEIAARLVVEASLSEADHLAWRITRMSVLISSALLLALLLLVYSLSTSLVSQPLKSLAALAEEVRRGNLESSPAVELASRKDEVGSLAKAFHAMLGALQVVQAENRALLSKTQEFNRQLEERVQEATTALEDKRKALADAREELARQERLAALGQLAGSIAHELGTPLNTLSGYLQLVLSSTGLAADDRESLQVASGEAERMSRIIRRFLDSTRGLRPTPEVIQLPEFIENVIALSVPPGMSTLKSRLELAQDAQSLVTDPGLLRQVVINLINNARDATQGHGTLVFRTARDGDTLVLQVEDDGPGITPELRDTIFTPFYTTKGPGRGTGLGLAISREIMRALRGTLTVQSPNSGTGACFELRLPLTPTGPSRIS